MQWEGELTANIQCQARRPEDVSDPPDGSEGTTLQTDPQGNDQVMLLQDQGGLQRSPSNRLLGKTEHPLGDHGAQQDHGPHDQLAAEEAAKIRVQPDPIDLNVCRTPGTRDSDLTQLDKVEEGGERNCPDPDLALELVAEGFLDSGPKALLRPLRPGGG